MGNHMTFPVSKRGKICPSLPYLFSFYIFSLFLG